MSRNRFQGLHRGRGGSLESQTVKVRGFGNHRSVANEWRRCEGSAPFCIAK